MAYKSRNNFQGVRMSHDVVRGTYGLINFNPITIKPESTVDSSLQMNEGLPNLKSLRLNCLMDIERKSKQDLSQSRNHNLDNSYENQFTANSRYNKRSIDLSQEILTEIQNQNKS
jgi:hypothetical protein